MVPCRIAAALLLAGAGIAAAEPDLAPDRREVLSHLLHQDCGACHGMRLEGGLGPALTAEALAGRSAAEIIGVIRHGRPGTAMPPWSGMLSEADMAWLAERLLRGEAADGD